jgi:TonB family protein
MAGYRYRRLSPGLLLLLALTACQTAGPVGENVAFTEDASAAGAISPPDFTRGLIARSMVTPLYPLMARQMGLEGWAMVSFAVDGNGYVVGNSIRLVDSEPQGYFENSAMQAARRIEFDNFSGRPVDDIRYVFRFELEEANRQVQRGTVQPRVRELIPRRYITPPYPESARNAGISGFAIVAFTVTSQGSVTDVRVVESEPAGVFDQVAREAAQRLIFEPRIVDDEPVAVEDVRFRFDWP